jgi:hypothetical protein
MRLAIAASLLSLAWPAGAAEDASGTPTADAIVERALERAERNDEERPEADFRYGLVSTLEKLDAEGAIEERNEKRYRLDLVEGHPFLRLLEIDGKPLSDEDAENAANRERAFREAIRERERSGAEPEEPREHEDTIYFDRDLVSRYRAELLEVRPYADRLAWVLRYEPGPGELPERRRVDKLLNATRGIIWIDTETHEVARLEFELMRTVRFWWFLGSVSHLSGYYERLPVDGVWLPSRGSLAIRGRALFNPIRRDQTAVWSDWARFDASERRVDKVPRPEDVPSHH